MSAAGEVRDTLLDVASGPDPAVHEDEIRVGEGSHGGRNLAFLSEGGRFDDDAVKAVAVGAEELPGILWCDEETRGQAEGMKILGL